MPYCVKCGVELDEKAEHCPLCLTPLALKAEHADRPGALNVLDPDDLGQLTETEERTLLWELFSVSLAIGAIVVAAIDLFLDSPGLSWSPYPLASIGLVWFLITAILQKKLALSLRLLGLALALPAYLLTLDLFDGRLSWSLTIAVPICLAAELVSGAFAFAIAKSRRKGANIAALVLTALALFCVALEAILDQSIAGTIRLGWSSIVLSALVPVAVFLYYLHYRILGTSRLRRFFHL